MLDSSRQVAIYAIQIYCYIHILQCVTFILVVPLKWNRRGLVYILRNHSKAIDMQKERNEFPISNVYYLTFCSPFCKIEFNARNIIDRFRLIYQVSYPDPKLHYDYKTNNLCRLILPKFVCIVSISVMCAK